MPQGAWRHERARFRSRAQRDKTSDFHEAIWKKVHEKAWNATELNLSVWSLSALQLFPAMARAAASAAEDAGLLIVAIHGEQTLPQPVKSFLHRCARAIHAADGALVAQLHGILKMNEEICPAYGCLREIAYHAGVRFFSEVVELPEGERARLTEHIPTEATLNRHLNPEPWNHS